MKSKETERETEKTASENWCVEKWILDEIMWGSATVAEKENQGERRKTTR